MNTPSPQQYRLHVQGMHCASCEILIEQKLSQVPGISKVSASLKQAAVEVTAGSRPQLAELNRPLHEHGYVLSWEQTQNKHRNPRELFLPFLAASIIFLLFIALQKMGIVNLVSPEKMTWPFIVLIGVIASLSTCMAVVGGLVLSISSSYAKGRHVKPLIFFHASRLISFFLLGGLIGLVGMAFILTPLTTFIINTILFAVMLIMGLNLLDFFHFSKKLQLKMPKFLGHKILGLGNVKSPLTPVLLGMATFFLPCGFTQSMQMLALSTGNYWQGATTMLLFALGTFPVLALISFLSLQFGPGQKARIFFRSMGFLIIFFAFLNFLSALAAIGVLPPLLNI